MAFLDVYNALYTQLKSDSTLSGYVQSADFLRGFKEPIPQQQYTVIIEPGDEDEDYSKQTVADGCEAVYVIEIYARVIFFKGVEYIIIGNTSDSVKGLLEFTEDIKEAIRADKTLGYNRRGSSVSAANSGTSFALTSSARYLTVTINGRTPSGYGLIDCGSSTLDGDDVASNIQTALRALGNYSDDGYNGATCTFDSDTKKFTITSMRYGPKSSVVVTAGASNDCSALLGFDDPTEVVPVGF